MLSPFVLSIVDNIRISSSFSSIRSPRMLLWTFSNYYKQMKRTRNIIQINPFLINNSYSMKIRMLSIDMKEPFNSDSNTTTCTIINPSTIKKTSTNNASNMTNTININTSVTTFDTSTSTSNTTIIETNTISNSAENWNWIPPRNQNDQNLNNITRVNQDDLIPIKPRVLLSTHEIINALQRLGGENIIAIKLKQPLEAMTDMIIVTGRSSKHLFQLASTIAKALKQRNLREAVGFQGVEGDQGEDWLAVDCFNIGLHCMLAKTRKSIDLESHLNSDSKPVISGSPDDKNYDKVFDSLLDKYPIPKDYDPITVEEVQTIKTFTKIPTNIDKL